MNLIKASQFAADYFEENSKPDMRTLKKWVQDNHVPGVFIGDRLYIDIDGFTHTMINQPSTPQKNNKLVCELY